MSRWISSQHQTQNLPMPASPGFRLRHGIGILDPYRLALVHPSIAQSKSHCWWRLVPKTKEQWRGHRHPRRNRSRRGIGQRNRRNPRASRTNRRAPRRGNKIHPGPEQSNHGLRYRGEAIIRAGFNSECQTVTMKLETLLRTNLEVGRVTPCAPGLGDCGGGAHGVTRPTLRLRVRGSFNRIVTAKK